MYYGKRPVNAPVPKEAPVSVRRLSQQQWKRRSSEIQDWEKQLLANDVAELKELFHYFDKDDSGYIDWKELRLIFEELGQKMSDHELQEMIRDVDGNRNGRIDWDEFLLVIQTMRMYANDADRINESKFKELSTLLLNTGSDCEARAILATGDILTELVENCLRDHAAIRSQKAKNLLRSELSIAKQGLKQRMKGTFKSMTDEVASALRGEARRHEAGIQASRASSFLQAIEKVLALRAQQKSMDQRHIHLTQHIRDELQEQQTKHELQLKAILDNNKAHEAGVKRDHIASIQRLEEDHQDAMHAMETRRESMKEELMQKIGILRQKIADQSLLDQRNGTRAVAEMDTFKAHILQRQRHSGSGSGSGSGSRGTHSTSKQIMSLTAKLEEARRELEATKGNLSAALKGYKETNEGKAEARLRRIHKHRYAALDREYTAMKNEFVAAEKRARELESENGELFNQIEAMAYVLPKSKDPELGNQSEMEMSNFDAVLLSSDLKLNTMVGKGFDGVREVRTICQSCRAQKTTTRRNNYFYSQNHHGRKTPMRHTPKAISRVWGSSDNDNTRNIRVEKHTQRDSGRSLDEAEAEAGLYVKPEVWAASPASATAVWREKSAQKHRADSFRSDDSGLGQSIATAGTGAAGSEPLADCVFSAITTPKRPNSERPSRKKK